jgi:hypothetical protein
MRKRISAHEGRQDKRFFFEKKKQKTFGLLDHAGFTATGPDAQKFFGSFFQKRTSSFLRSP